MKKITKQDFTQVDSHWICVINGLHLSLKRGNDGSFNLAVMGDLETIPPATTSPTEPEWDLALRISNYLVPLALLAERRTTGKEEPQRGQDPKGS